ncbi:hypothetical protein PO902_16760 [Planococcus maritimus]|nr:hypothetical protein [Planococcus sp. SK3692]MDE4086699.1 hypothetical protein [Planococcus maritimus]
MSKRKNFYKQSLSVAVLGSALFIAGCGTANTTAEQPAESEQAEAQTTTASDGSGETEKSEEDDEEAEETEEARAETETASTDAGEQAVPEDQQGITTAFPLGTALEDLIKHYGQPGSDEFFLGSRLVIFNEKDGYFLDEQDTVKGFFIANPEVSIFGTSIGMTFKEIDGILGASEELFYDEPETQSYIGVYYEENYRISYASDTETGPVRFAIVVRSK